MSLINGVVIGLVSEVGEGMVKMKQGHWNRLIWRWMVPFWIG